MTQQGMYGSAWQQALVREVPGRAQVVLANEIAYLPELRPTDTGGYLAIFKDTGGEGELPPLILCCMVGTVSDAKKYQKYQDFAKEKALRLWRHPEHHTSGESANEELLQYPGAIRMVIGDEKYIISFSGFPAEVDEVIVAHVAFKMDGANLPILREIVKRRPGNKLLARAVADMRA